MISKILVSSINEALHNFELVLTGQLKTMAYFHFKESFQQLLPEICLYNNLTEANIDIIVKYYSMMEVVKYTYEKWDAENYESHPDYNVINSMYCELWNVCYNELLHFLKTYANDRLIDVDTDDPLSITGELKDIDAMVSPPQPIQSSKDLREVLNDIFEHEIRNFIENEGFYKLVNKQCDEDFIQKALKLQLENALLRRHIRAIID